MKLKQWTQLLASILLTMTIGAISGIATSKGVSTWYLSIVKPSFNPPNYIFAPVWSILYLLMGISLFMIWKSDHTVARKNALRIFMVQLTLNFLWSIIFFGYHNIGLALLDIVLLWGAILAMIILSYRVSKTASLLQIPYLFWVSFATVLNSAILYLN